MSSINPVDLWKNSLLNSKEPSAKSNISTTPVFITSPVISSFSGDAEYLRRVFKAWPIKMERKAVFWPAHATFIACGTAGIVIGVRVNSHTFLGDANHPYAESLRKCPRLTWLIALYSSALLYFGINENTVSKYLFSIITALLGGICFPMLSSPYLTAAAKVGVNACRGILLPTILGLSAVYGVSMYIRLWGRKRIIDTLSVEPEFIAEVDEH